MKPTQRQRIEIKGKFATLNEHDAANRGNKFGGATLKKRMTDMVMVQCGRLKPITAPITISFFWRYSSRHDFDNIRFAAKYILDGLVKSGKLPNDNQKWIRGFDGDFFIKVEPGMESVTLLILDAPDI